MHEHGGDQREIDGNRRWPQARLPHLLNAFGCALDLDMGLGDDVSAGDDFLRHRRERHRERLVRAESLEDDEHDHVGGDQAKIDDRKFAPVADCRRREGRSCGQVVVVERKTNSRARPAAGVCTKDRRL